VLEMLPDGSYRSVLIASRITGRKRDALIAAARRGGALEEDQARYVRVIEYDVPDREGDGKDELLALVTTITDFRAATAQALAGAYHQRWEHEIGHRWYRSSCAAFSWLRSFVVAGFRFLRCPAGAAVEARRACPAFA
jgi:hypothetical protein